MSWRDKRHAFGSSVMMAFTMVLWPPLPQAAKRPAEEKWASLSYMRTCRISALHGMFSRSVCNQSHPIIHYALPGFWLWVTPVPRQEYFQGLVWCDLMWTNVCRWRWRTPCIDLEVPEYWIDFQCLCLSVTAVGHTGTHNCVTWRNSPNNWPQRTWSERSPSPAIMDESLTKPVQHLLIRITPFTNTTTSAGEKFWNILWIAMAVLSVQPHITGVQYTCLPLFVKHVNIEV